jgi:hypothetical protein
MPAVLLYTALRTMLLPGVAANDITYPQFCGLHSATPGT